MEGMGSANACWLPLPTRHVNTTSTWRRARSSCGQSPPPPPTQGRKTPHPSPNSRCRSRATHILTWSSCRIRARSRWKCMGGCSCVWQTGGRGPSSSFGYWLFVNMGGRVCVCVCERRGDGHGGDDRSRRPQYNVFKATHLPTPTYTRRMHTRTSTRSRGTVLPMISIFFSSSESSQMNVRKKISRRMTCSVSLAGNFDFCGPPSGVNTRPLCVCACVGREGGGGATLLNQLWIAP